METLEDNDLVEIMTNSDSERYKPSNSKIPIYNWAARIHELDDKTRQQAENLVQLPFAVHHLALMHDAHAGYGMPIGGVLFARDAVVPYAIGVDIGCGVQLARTGLVWEETLTRDTLKTILLQIQRDVPTGFKTHKNPVVDEWNTWNACIERTRFPRVEDSDELLPYTVITEFYKKSLTSLGTMGGGNHFLEFQRDEENNVYVMLHSGSRSLGKYICDYYHKKALELNIMWHSELPDKELAYLPTGTEEYRGYIDAMNFALRWAELSREQMMAKVIYALGRYTVLPDFSVTTDIHHNFAAWENHYGINGLVHRKGAVRAREGETVLIPGSMGTASYVAEGLGNKESFQSCQHGAGRNFGRKAISKLVTHEEVYADMEEKGIELLSAAKHSVQEEAPRAYKDIDAVMAASTDLVKITKKLYPLGVVKG